MNEAQRVVVNETLDALDRLYDQESSVVDVRALLVVGIAALGQSPYLEVFRKAEARLEAIIKSTFDDELERNRAAVAATDELRHVVADAWSEDQIEQPSSG